MKNKFLKGVMTLGVASAICLGMGITASAAAIDESGIEIDAASQTLTVKEEIPAATPPTGGTGTSVTAAADTSTLDREVLFSVSSVKSGKLKAGAWEIYDMKDTVVKVDNGQGGTTDKNYKAVTIDLSSLNTQKDNYIQIRGDRNDDVIVYKIPATDKTLKPKFDLATGKVADAAHADAKYEYRTQYGAWEEYKADTDLTLYQQRGATLYFRAIAATPANAADEPLTDATKGSTKTFTAKTKTSLPGKEIKVKIAKRSGAPKAKISYTKNTVTVPKDVVYRVFSSGDATLPTFDETKVTANKEEVSDMATLRAGGSLEFYTKKANKANSLIAHYDFPEQGAIAGEAGADGSVVTATIDGITAAFDKVKDKYNLKITSSSTDKYEVFYDSATAPTATTRGIKSLAAGKTLTLKDVKDDKLVWIRKAGDQKNSKWATEWVTMGKVVLPTEEGGGSGDTGLTAQQKLDKIVTEFFNSGTVSVAEGDVTADAEVPILKCAVGTISWGTAKEYTLTDGTKITATVTAVNGDTSGRALTIGADGIPKFQNGARSGDSGVVKVTFAIDENTSVEKTITVSITA